LRREARAREAGKKGGKEKLCAHEYFAKTFLHRLGGSPLILIYDFLSSYGLTYAIKRTIFALSSLRRSTAQIEAVIIWHFAHKFLLKIPERI
jgi:hypothetical protein